MNQSSVRKLNIVDRLLHDPSHVLVQYSSAHWVCKCTVQELLNANIVNWEKNRPPDYTRCRQIASQIYKTQQPMDGMISILLDDKVVPKYCILDGIHRYTALKHIYVENTKPEDLLTPNEFGHDGNATWLMDSIVILNIKYGLAQGQAEDWFRAINNSNPVPELYIADNTCDKKLCIEELTCKWMNMYKACFTPNKKYNRPNINREVFIELLDQLYDKMGINKSNEYLLEWKLEELNHKVCDRVPFLRPKLTAHILDKCEKTGCYLFLEKTDAIVEMI
jgi:hypothetical protein